MSLLLASCSTLDLRTAARARAPGRRFGSPAPSFGTGSVGRIGYRTQQRAWCGVSATRASSGVAGLPQRVASSTTLRGHYLGRKEAAGFLEAGRVQLAWLGKTLGLG